MNYRAFPGGLLLAALAFALPAGAQTLTMSPNTSATSTTGAFTNGTLSGQTNVSQGSGIYNIHSLLYSGHTTKVLIHYLPWFDGGMDSGIDVNYSSADSTYANKLFTDLVGRGVDGLLVDYQGASDITGTSWAAMHSIIHSYTSLSMAMMLDANLLNNYSGTATNKVLAAMSDISSYFSDAQYLTYGGKTVVADFGLTDPAISPAVDWASIQSSYPNVQFVHLDNAASSDGFSITDSGGSFLWVNPSTSGGSFSSDESSFYTRALTHSSQIAIGAAYKGFSNMGTDGTNFAPWDGNTRTYIDQQCGETWLTSWANINSKFSTTHQLPFVQLVTWDDYYEGTPLETGIDNCLAVNITQSGSLPSKTITLNFTGSGSTDTLAEIQLWGYYSGAWHYVTYPPTTTSFVITGANTYYVKLVGKPFIKNYLTPGFAVS